MTNSFPEEVDAMAFLALTKFEIGSQQEGPLGAEMVETARVLFQNELKRFPNHPGLLHYYVHSCDFPDQRIASMALNEAKRLADIAPDSSHAIHMITHLLLVTGDWNEFTQYNLKAFEAGNRFCGTDTECDMDNRYHSIEWIHYGYLQQNMLEQASTYLFQMRDLATNDEKGGQFKIWFSRMRTRQIWHVWNIEPDCIGTIPDPIPFSSKQDPYWGLYTQSSEVLAEVLVGSLNSSARIGKLFRHIKQEAAKLQDSYLSYLIDSDWLMANASYKRGHFASMEIWT